MTHFDDPSDSELAVMSVVDLRKVYAFYRRAAIYGMGEKALDAHLARLAPKTPIEWIKAVRSARTKCTRCDNGIYHWGAIVNGIPTHSGKCYRCEGKGYTDMSDFRRNRGYDNHAIRRAFAC